VGTTRDRSKYYRYKLREQPLKAVLVSPLDKHFHKILCHG